LGRGEGGGRPPASIQYAPPSKKTGRRPGFTGDRFRGRGKVCRGSWLPIEYAKKQKGKGKDDAYYKSIFSAWELLCVVVG